MDPGTILVTGGAGYIGSHVVLQLRARAERVVVLDNLSTGFRRAVLDCPLVVGNMGDRVQVLAVLREHSVDTVMHFAANTVVPESVADPLKYYANNTCGTQNLLKCCTEVGVRQFVFSSTAAVYGIPEEPYAEETTPTVPINPYGTSKLMSEWMLRDVAAATGMRYVALRYFNVAGSDSQGRIGQSTAKSRSASARKLRFLVPTMRRRTAPACATTFTWRTSPRHIWMRLITSALAANRPFLTAATDTATASEKCSQASNGWPESRCP